MVLSLNAAYSSWNRFLRKGVSGEPKLLRLPEDILVGEIFKWLSVRDIVRLRQVCRHLALLTKRPEIWKRFLPYVEQIRQPLAPLPPTRAYNLHNLTGHEMETIVTRAISYDTTWKRRQIECRNVLSLYAHYHVQEVVLLPGGHFLVMSVRTFDGRYGLVIWSLEHRETRKPAPLVFRETEVKAYGVTAKYMMMGEYRTLVVAFLRKRHKDANDTRYIPETFEMGGREGPEDPYMPIKYECTVVAVSLCVLDHFNERKVAPMTDEFESRIKFTASCYDRIEANVWETLARIRTGTQLGAVSLDVIGGVPHVCVVKRPNKIVFQVLHPLLEIRSILECRPMTAYELTRHTIWNFRVLPEQDRVLVVRNIEKKVELEMANDHLAIELYRIPELEQTVVDEATAFTVLRLRQYLNVQISEVQRTVSPDEDESITPDLKRGRRPQPLSLFLRTQTGMAHHSLWPIVVPMSPDESSPTQVIYDPTRSNHICFGDPDADNLNGNMEANDGQVVDCDAGNKRLPRRRKDDAMHFIPGARRAFVYAIPRNYGSTYPPITACWGFQYNRRDRTAFPGDDANDEDEMDLLETIDLLETDVPDSPMSATNTLPDDPDAPYHPSLDVPPAPLERKTILGPIKLPDRLRNKLLHGVSGVSFDEDSGRLVLATKVDNRLHVVDFACTRPRDADDIELDEMKDEELKDDPQWGRLESY